MIKGNIIYANKQKVTSGEMKCFLGQMGIRNEFMQETDYCVDLDQAEKDLKELPDDKQAIVYNTVDGNNMFIITAEDVKTTYDVPESVADAAVQSIFKEVEEESASFRPAKGLDGEYSDWISLIECQCLIEEVVTEYLKSIGIDVD